MIPSGPRIEIQHDGDAALVLLVRHARTAALGRWLCGRQSGVTLSSEGRDQAARLARAIAARYRLDAVYTSPLERAGATADAVAQAQRIVAAPCDAMSEVDFGEWTGKHFDELDADPRWRAFNERRRAAVVPAGERADAVQARVVNGLAALAARHAGGTIAVVSHADPLRYALLAYRAVSIDQVHALTIDPASVSAVAISPAGARIHYVNDTTFAG